MVNGNNNDMSQACPDMGGGGLFPLTPTASQTLASMSRLAPGSALQVSPLCMEHPEGQRDVRGWVLDTPAGAPASALPLSCRMFDGVSVVRCECDEGAILNLLLNEADTRRRLGDAVGEILHNTAMHPERRATWARCRPTANGHPRSLHSAILTPTTSTQLQGSFFQPQGTDPVLDSEPWQPELAHEGFVGLFHHWHSSDLRKRSLTLYVACQTYLPRAALEIADMIRAIGADNTAAEISHAEELHWLRTASSRNRARILARVCTRLGLQFPVMSDYHTQTAPEKLAICATETLHHDIRLSPCGKYVRVLNYCSDTARAFNGSVCTMAPWDGLWIFHGSSARMRAQPGDFGAPYGMHFLPTAAPRLPQAQQLGNAAVGCSTADPRKCRVLQVWPDSEEELAAACSVVVQPPAPPLAAYDGQRDEQDLDSDMLQVYKRSLARQLAPITLMLPGFPGTGNNARSYVQFDEHVLQAMAQRGWDRAHGYTALIPIACALVEHWKARLPRDARADAEAGSI